MNGDLPEEIAQQIMDYLSAHPRARDTPAGIANWWLHRQRVVRGLEQVEQALLLLERQGQVTRSINRDGSVFCSLSDQETGRD
jgi:hypothetical protein